MPRKGDDDDCLTELRWLYDRRNLQEARNDLAAWLTKWSSRYPKLCDWGEANIEQTLTFYRLPQPHHKHLKSTNLLERLNEELKRRTSVIRIFPNTASCLRLIRALAWRSMRTGSRRYLNMELLSEQKKEQLRQIHTAARRPAARATPYAAALTGKGLHARSLFAELDVHNCLEKSVRDFHLFPSKVPIASYFGFDFRPDWCLNGFPGICFI